MISPAATPLATLPATKETTNAQPSNASTSIEDSTATGAVAAARPTHPGARANPGSALRPESPSTTLQGPTHAMPMIFPIQAR